MSKVYTQNQWNETIDAMQTGQAIEIDEGVFDYFLDVLPPVFMGRRFTFKDGQSVSAVFGFAEGCEPVTVFWKEGEQHFCRQSTLINPNW